MAKFEVEAVDNLVYNFIVAWRRVLKVILHVRFAQTYYLTMAENDEDM